MAVSPQQLRAALTKAVTELRDHSYKLGDTEMGGKCGLWLAQIPTMDDAAVADQVLRMAAVIEEWQRKLGLTR